MALASTSVTGEAKVTRLCGHSSRLANHLGPFHQSDDPLTDPPRLARSAGFSSELAYRHSMSACALIFATLSWTNSLYSPPPRIQCRGTVLSNHPYTFEIGNPSIASLTFVSKIVAIWPATSSRQGMERLSFARRAFAATSRCVVPDACFTTA